MIYVENNSYLEHHGIKGQKWGVRRYQNPDGTLTAAGKAKLASGDSPRYTKRVAKKDAKEYARAQMYYGEGAGNRRKLIKATVEQHKKNDPFYEKEFERQLSNQDMASHASKARAERKTRDAASATVRTTNALARKLFGTSITVASLYVVAHQTGLDQKIMEYGRQYLGDIF